MKGILADNDVRGQVEYLVALMNAEPWREFWLDLRLTLYHFEDFGLNPTATDQEIWERCQAEQVVLITGNRTLSGPDSLEATIRLQNTAASLPVLTIADAKKVNFSRAYAGEVVESLIDYLQRIDTVRGVGRLYLP
ncbi:MAG: ACP S-malonyltransferase [Planctomycetes bacterium]|nr:ACP S-malonyltransferase [Planctomycetota bacterium]